MSSVILYCDHWPAARGMGTNVVGGGIAPPPACSIPTRRSMSAFAAGSIDGPQPASVIVATNNRDSGRKGSEP